MLPASSSAPNRQKSTPPKAAPKPSNWRGVAAGIADAQQAILSGNIAHAIHALKEVLEFAPHEPQAWELLGEILRQQGQDEKAKRCFAKLDTIRQKQTQQSIQPPLSRRLAQLHWQQGDKESALAMLAVLLIRQPNDPHLLDLRHQWVPGEQE